MRDDVLLKVNAKRRLGIFQRRPQQVQLSLRPLKKFLLNTQQFTAIQTEAAEAIGVRWHQRKVLQFVLRRARDEIENPRWLVIRNQRHVQGRPLPVD